MTPPKWQPLPREGGREGGKLPGAEGGGTAAGTEPFGLPWRS